MCQSLAVIFVLSYRLFFVPNAKCRYMAPEESTEIFLLLKYNESIKSILIKWKQNNFCDKFISKQFLNNY